MTYGAGPPDREISHELREAIDEAARIAVRARRVARDAADQEEIRDAQAQPIESEGPSLSRPRHRTDIASPLASELGESLGTVEARP